MPRTERQRLINFNTSTSANMPDIDDFDHGEIAVRYNTDIPELIIKRADNSLVSFKQNSVKVYQYSSGSVTPGSATTCDVTDTNVLSYFDGLGVMLKLGYSPDSVGGLSFQINELGYKPVMYSDGTLVGEEYHGGEEILLVYNSSFQDSTGAWQVVNSKQSSGVVVRTWTNDNENTIKCLNFYEDDVQIPYYYFEENGYDDHGIIEIVGYFQSHEEFTFGSVVLNNREYPVVVLDGYKPENPEIDLFYCYVYSFDVLPEDVEEIKELIPDFSIEDGGHITTVSFNMITDNVFSGDLNAMLKPEGFKDCDFVIYQYVPTPKIEISGFYGGNTGWYFDIHTYEIPDNPDLYYKLDDGDWTLIQKDENVYITELGQHTVQARCMVDGEWITDEKQDDLGIWLSESFIQYWNNGQIRIEANEVYPADSVVYYKIDDGEWQEMPDNDVYFNDMWGHHTVYMKAEYGQYTAEVNREMNIEPYEVNAYLIPVPDGVRLQIGARGEVITGTTKVQYSFDGGPWTDYDSENPEMIDDTDSHNVKTRRVVRYDETIASEVKDYDFRLDGTPQESRMFTIVADGNVELVWQPSGGYENFLQYSNDGVTWNDFTQTVSTTISINNGETLYVRGFGCFGSLSGREGTAVISGCVDALISPVYKIPENLFAGCNTYRQIGFENLIDGSNITLSSYSQIIAYRMFAGNKETLTYSNFIYNGRGVGYGYYDGMFAHSNITHADNLVAGCMYNDTFMNSKIQSIPLLPFNENDRDNTYLFKDIFRQCNFPMSSDSGETFDFGQNNFSYPIAGCNTPKELAKHMGNATGYGNGVTFYSLNSLIRINGSDLWPYSDTYFINDYNQTISLEFIGSSGTFVKWQMREESNPDVWIDISNSPTLEYVYNGNDTYITIEPVIDDGSGD